MNDKLWSANADFMLDLCDQVSENNRNLSGIILLFSKYKNYYTNCKIRTSD